jgi:hypothetical protein
MSRRVLSCIVIQVIVCLVIVKAVSAIGPLNNCKMWTVSNSSWIDKEITVASRKIVGVTISKTSSLSVLKITFSGGRLSFISDKLDSTLNAQVVISIIIDGTVVAEKLDYDCCQGFRNQYPTMSAIVTGITSGEHAVYVAVSKTANPGEGGRATYTTTIGHDPNTYKADLVIEEWSR